MDSSAPNIFQQFLIEEYEKHKDGKYVDVVAKKRREFNMLVEKAHEEQKNKSYVSATKEYYTAVKLLKYDPYPDEYDLSAETDYLIKCCFCYSGLKSPERFKDEDESKALLDVIQELNEKYRTRLFPMFLLVLLNFHRKKWLATLTWCSEIASYMNEADDNNQELEIFNELLPKLPEIKYEVETCEEIAYFGYGESITRNALLKPRYEKYKDWACKFNHFTNTILQNFKAPISEDDLHIIFHHEIFPIWCMASGKEYERYYSDKFLMKCPECTRGKLYSSVKEKGDITPEVHAVFDGYIDKCTDFYQMISSGELLSETGKSKGGKVKLRAVGKDVSNVAEKTTNSTQSQTDKVKNNNKHIQTEGVKTKNVEVQVNNESSQLLTAVLEIKNKCLTLQEKKDDTINKLNRRINDMHYKLVKDATAKKDVSQEFEKKGNAFKCEIQQLKEKLKESEKKHRADKEKNISLRKLLVQQTTDKYNTYKQHHKVFEKQASFMVAYLKELITFLTPKSIPTDRTCREHLDLWEGHLQRVRRDLEQLDNVYQKARTDMINSDTYEVIWPELPNFPRFEDNVVFLNFKSAIRDIIETKEKLYWRYNADCQVQPQAQYPPVGRPPLNIYTQFPVQNSMYVGPRLVYANTAVTPMPVSVPYRPQNVPMLPKRDIPPLDINLPNGNKPDTNVASKANLKGSKSTEFLNTLGTTPLTEFVDTAGSSQSSSSPKQHCEKKGGSGVKKKQKKEKEMILLDYVLEHCPGATEEEVTLALLQLLDENKGTLSKIPVEKIIGDVRIILRTKKQPVWVKPKSPLVDWENDHTENICAICIEDFSLKEKYALPCKHEYHKDCIKEWLKTSSVCPFCRVHCVIDEEFPPLH